MNAASPQNTRCPRGSGKRGARAGARPAVGRTVSVEAIASPQSAEGEMSPSAGRAVPAGTCPASRGGQVAVVWWFEEPIGIHLSTDLIKGVGRSLF